MNRAIPVIEGEALTKTFRSRGRTVHAVQGVSLGVRAGEALGIVGESGCGKTTTARLLLRLEEPSSGAIRFLGDDITTRQGLALLPFRARAQLVFQNPFDALNPRFTIRRALTEPLRNFGIPRPGARGAHRRGDAPRACCRPKRGLIVVRTSCPVGSCSVWFRRGPCCRSPS